MTADVTGSVLGMRTTLVGMGLFASAFSPVLVAIALVLHPFESGWADAALVLLCAAPALLVGVTLRSARLLQDTRLVFEPSPQTRYLIPKALADDFLRSELTDRHYEVGSKQRIDGRASSS